MLGELEEECSTEREQVKRLCWGCELCVCEEKKAARRTWGVRRDGVEDEREARSHRASQEFQVCWKVIEGF